MSVSALLNIITEATKKVPFVKYALGVAAIGAIVALVKAYQIDLKVALWGTFVVIFLMVILFVAARAASTTRPGVRGSGPSVLSTFFLWAVVIIFLAIMCLLTSCVFFKMPVDLSNVLKSDSEKKYDFFIKDSLTSLPVNIPVEKLHAQLEGSTRMNITSLNNGAYQTDELSLTNKKSDKLILTLVEQKEWLFDNNLLLDTISLVSANHILFVKRDPKFLRVWGRLTNNLQPIPGTVIKLRLSSGEELSDTTNADGNYSLQLPSSEQGRTFEIRYRKRGRWIVAQVGLGRNDF